MIDDEIAFLRGLSKPLRNAGYDEISKMVNEEISKLGDTGTFADLAKQMGIGRASVYRALQA